MLKKMFFGLNKPRVEYEKLPAKISEPTVIPATEYVTLFHQQLNDRTVPSLLRNGDTVKTGQKISLYADDPAYVISPVTGTIRSVSPYAGDFGVTYSAISVEIDPEEIMDDQFQSASENPSIETAAAYLSWLPGLPPFHLFTESEKEIHTIVINGVDDDLLIGTNQHIVRSKLDVLQQGIARLKEITGLENIILVTASESMQGYGHIGASVNYIGRAYPAGLPHMIVKDILGEVVPAGKNIDEMGIAFFSAEAVAGIGQAFSDKKIPVSKLITLITKDGYQRLIETSLGTPIRDILETYDVTLNEEDRIILGGPMRGSAIYSLEHPIQPDTDAIMVLDRKDAAYVTDYPCINCGDCVRACPARIPVNLLVRFLEAGQYEEAADNYDLHSCIECGLCSYVCVSKIPVSQYIRLAKYELERAKTSEAANA
jgi:electron transport complex protein RnfC